MALGLELALVADLLIVAGDLKGGYLIRKMGCLVLSKLVLERSMRTKQNTALPLFTVTQRVLDLMGDGMQWVSLTLEHRKPLRL